MKLDLWFPTPVYSVMIDSHESMNPQLTEVIRQHQQQHPSIQASNMLGYHSNSDLHQEADYQGLVSELNRAMREIESQEAITQPCELVNLWFNVNPVGSHNAEHTHPRSDWSGVYYVQTPADSGVLHLQDPRDRAHSQELKLKPQQETNPRLWRDTRYQPQPGLLLIFPAWLRHSVGINLAQPNGEASDRISISFNFVQKWFD